MRLDETIHQPQRLRIMATLFAHRQAGWRELRDALGLSDGNLAGHLARLVAAGYVTEARVFTGARFEQRYGITERGSDAFREYARELEAVLAGARQAP